MGYHLVSREFKEFLNCVRHTLVPSYCSDRAAKHEVCNFIHNEVLDLVNDICFDLKKYNKRKERLSFR